MTEESKDSESKIEETKIEFPSIIFEEDSRFDKFDKRIKKHQEDLPKESEFNWCDHLPFEFYFLYVGMDVALRYGKDILVGHAKAANGSECPFPQDEWKEVKLPLTTELHNQLMLFAQFKDVKSLSDFKNQLFYVEYFGITTFDDPHVGNTRLYGFRTEMINEDGTRISLEEVRSSIS